MKLKKLLKTDIGIQFSELVSLESEYNECGGYITGYDKDNNNFSILHNSDSDLIYELIEELADHLKIKIK